MNSHMEKNSTNPDIELVFPNPIKTLNEQEHVNNQDLVKKLNEVIVILNRLKSAL